MLNSFKKRLAPLAIWLNPFIMFMCGFTLPISSSFKSFFFPWAVLNVLFLPDPISNKSVFKRLHDNKNASFLTYILLLIFLIILISLLYSPASLSEIGTSLSKNAKILYFPFLVVALSDSKSRKYTLYGFLLAMILTSLLGIFSHFGFLTNLLPDPDNIFRNHIITGFMLSFAAFICMQYLCLGYFKKRVPYSKPKLVASLLSLILFAYEMYFINGGRMSYLMFILLLSYAIYAYMPAKQAILAVGFMIIFVVFAFILSHSLQTRFHDTLTEIALFQKSDISTSLGYRYEFQVFAHNLWEKHPIMGNGVASFAHYFTLYNPVPTWNTGLLEPHNQYWLFAVEYGLIGLSILLFLFFISFMKSFQLGDYGILYRGLLMTFLLGNLTDSLLFYSGPGYFYLLMTALCFAKANSGAQEQNFSY